MGCLCKSNAGSGSTWSAGTSAKSTLMKIISGETIHDAGEVIREQGLRIAWLEQEVPQDLSGTVFEIVAAGVGNMVSLLTEYHSVSHRLSHGYAGAIAELERIQHLIESSGGGRNPAKGRDRAFTPRPGP